MGQPTVLLISGNRSQTTLLHNHLRAVGFQVFESNHGSNVAELLVQVQPRLAVLDWDLPDLSALAVIRIIRGQPGFTRLPLILIGTEISCENKILSLEAGVDFCVDGPLFPKELMARVRALMRRVNG